MVAVKKEQPEAPAGFVVDVPMAYVHAKSGEVKVLTKGDVVSPDLYRPESIEHLLSIGFLVEQ